ncbi:MAG: DUF362 domain-containing protein [Methanomassiliicoccales archaeon]|nr:MAG: DUF362 domain-containing protein [Methanomassiliicoccales archaeon]
MSPNRVSLVRCDGYGREVVHDAVEKSVDLLGGIGMFVAPGEKVLVKPNMLQPSPPERAVCTHPDILHAVCRILLDLGCKVTVADSPGAGSIYGPSQLSKGYDEVGYSDLAELGVTLNTDVSYVNVPNPSGRLIKMFPVIRPAVEADAIVVVSKLKTHMLTYLTAATKNIFGVVQGMDKATFHGRLPLEDDFSDMLVDLNELMRPRLQIVDAVMAMEGDGPYSGTPRRVNAIIAGPSYAHVDVVASKLIGAAPGNIPTIKAAVRRGVLDGPMDDIEVVGERLEDMAVPDFRPPATYNGKERTGRARLMERAASLMKAYALRPSIVSERCTGCGRCVRACPKHVISLRDGKARVHYNKCIRCYTCHEMCTSGAVELKRSAGGKIIGTLVERGNKTRSSK